MANDQTTAAPAPTPAAPQQEGFLHSIATSLGVDPEAVRDTARAILSNPHTALREISGEAADELENAATHPLDTLKQTAQGVVDQITNPQAQAVAKQRWAKPGIMNKVTGAEEYLTSGVPIVGGNIAKAEEQGAEGNVRGSLGTMVGTVGPVLLEEGARRAPEAIHEAAANARENMAARHEASLNEARSGKIIDMPGEPKQLKAATPELPEHITFEDAGGKEVAPPAPKPEAVPGEEPQTAVALRTAANAYNEVRGLPPIDSTHVEEDPRSSEVADAYKAAVHAPNDPAVKESYDALKRDIDEQYDLAKGMGIQMETADENPYGLSTEIPAHQELHNDVLNNQHLAVWKGGAPPADHPLSEVDPKTGLTYNEKFRMVHDIFGHAVEREGFEPAGEESAWNLHRQMFSPAARPALATETKGQAAYTYKYGDFPPQKAALLPEHLQVRPEDLASEPELAAQGKLPGQSVNMSEAYGDSGRYVGGLDKPSEDFTMAKYREDALPSTHEVTITNADGTEQTVPITSHSTQEAMDKAYKQFPEARSWELTKMGEPAQPAGYNVPVARALSTVKQLGKSPLETFRHELGHAMIGMKEGMTQAGMLRHTHPDSPKNAVAAMLWRGQGMFDYAGNVRPEKLPAMVKSLMGGIAADEAYNGIQRSQNHNLDATRAGSDGNIALKILTGLGYHPVDAAKMMHAAIDDNIKYLTQPHVQDVVRENAAVREPNLSKQYHFSPERLNAMHAETERRANGTTQATDNGTTGTGGTQVRAADVTEPEGTSAPTTGEGITTSEITPELAPGETLEDRAIKAYGLTDDPAKMGFILPDGRGLDFSQGRPARSLDHGDVSSILPRKGPDAVAYNENPREVFTERTGAARIMIHGGGVNVVLPESGMTTEQGDVILQAAEKNGGKVTIDIRQRGKIGSASATISEPEDLDRLVRDAKKDARTPGAGTVSARPLTMAEKAAPTWHTKAGDLAAENPAGGINPRNGRIDRKGIGVEILPEYRQPLDHAPTADDFQNFYQQHQDIFDQHPELRVGWDNNSGAPGGHEINIGAVGQGAPRVARKLDQIAAFDIAKGENIPTGGAGKQTQFPDYPLADRMTDLRTPEDTISTRYPWAKKITEDPMGHGLSLDRKAIFNNSTLLDKYAERVKNYPGFKSEASDSAGVVNDFIDHVKGNLEWIYNQVPPEEQMANRAWYDGANKIANNLSKEHGYEPPQAAGVIASLSPQKDWNMNVSLAQRLTDIVTNHANEKTTPEMLATGKVISETPTGAGMKHMLKDLKGQSLKTLDEPGLQALWVRLYDETYNPREYQMIGPDGNPRGPAQNMDGSSARVAWGALNEIKKAMSILDDGSRDNISQSLGRAHKVRHFYNNIVEPNSPRNDVTVDTHAVAAGLLRPLGGFQKEVIENFGRTQNAAQGIKGTYPLYHIAYQEAAKDLDIPHARQLQSVVWEKIRNWFPSEFKTPENQEAIDAIWKEYANGRISVNDARNRILEYAQSHAGTDAEVRHPDDQRQLFGNSVLGTPAEGNRTGVGGGDTGESEVPETEIGDTSFNFGHNEPAPKKPAAKKSGKISALDLLKSLGGLKEPGKSR